MPEIDTFNRFMVGVRGERIVVLRPPVAPMTADEALTLAAHLVALADYYEDGKGSRFEQIREAVEGV
jgi:hypothetical protein